MKRKRKKIKKLRGSRTHGYGSKKKHRGKGSKGGKGYAGSHKHHYIKIMKYEPEHFGKKGFVSKKKEKAINIDQALKLCEKMKTNTIDLTSLRFDKLLSRGQIEKPITIKVRKASKKTVEKIEKLGGKLVLVGEGEKQ